MASINGEPHLFAEAGQEDRPSHPLQLAPLFQQSADGHQVHRLVFGVEIQHSPENFPVSFPVEIARTKPVRYRVQDLRAYQDGPQDRLLRFWVSRWIVELRLLVLLFLTHWNLLS